jgi:glycosyltransferase involved in cell wall biosynthesis
VKFCFVTFGNFNAHATLKRATGMAHALQALGHEVYLLLEDAPDNRAKAALECPGVEVHYHIRTRSPWAERKSKVITTKRLRPDIVWLCGVGIRNWITRFEVGAIVLGDHVELLSGIESVPRYRRAWDLITEWLHLVTLSGHVCASRYLEQIYQKRQGRLGLNAPIHYSPYAFHSGVLRSDLRSSGEISRRYGDGKKNILYMGSFWENYGIWDMLDVFRDLASERTDFRVLLMGKGPAKEAAQRWIVECGFSDRIIILGFVAEEELAEYFSLAHAFVCPLRDTVQDWARCPSKLYMYLPFKKPVVTSPIGEALELFGRIYSFFYRPGDRAELKQALRRVLECNDIKNLPEPADHSWEARVSGFLEWLPRQKF